MSLAGVRVAEVVDGASWNGRIQVLRAWAIASVLLFHFGVPGFGHGYLGVDMFFVVSGLLMAQRVIPAVLAGRFSLGRFLAARARRTLPALAALILVLLVLGWWLLPPLDYRRLAKHAAASASLLSNWIYLHEGGYFDVDASQKWLLHTWSLAVEWQFYLLFPLVVLAAARVRRAPAAVWAMLAGLAAASLAGFAASCEGWCTRAYFGFDTRAWQPLAGVLAFGWLAARPAQEARARWLGALGGLALVAVVVGPQGAAPSALRHLMAVAGAVAWLGGPARGQAGISPVARWLGEVSYGVYLWHWPLAVALAFGLWPRSAWAAAAAVALSLALGALSARLVERPLQAGLAPARLVWQGAALLATIALPALLAVALYASGGWPGRVPDSVRSAEREALNTNPRRGECFRSADTPPDGPPCRYGDPSVPGAVLVGDSHADAIVGALGQAAGAAGRGLWFHGYSGCPPLPHARRLDRPENQCGAFYDGVRARIDALPKDVAVVLAARWTVYLDGYLDPSVAAQPLVSVGPAEPAARRRQAYLDALESTLCSFAARRPTFVLTPVPEMPTSVPQQLARTELWGRAGRDLQVEVEDYRRRHRDVLDAIERSASRCGVRPLRVEPLLCASGACPAVHGGRAAYYDDHHLSEYGNRLLLPLFGPVFGGRGDPPR